MSDRYIDAESLIIEKDKQIRELQAEIARLKELILRGYPYIEEEWTTVKQFGLIDAVKWYSDMRKEIQAIKES